MGTNGAEPDGRRRRRSRAASRRRGIPRAIRRAARRGRGASRGGRARARRDRVRHARAVRAPRGRRHRASTRSSRPACRASLSPRAIRIPRRAGGVEQLRAAGIAVDVGVEESDGARAQRAVPSCVRRAPAVGDAQARAVRRRRDRRSRAVVRAGSRARSRAARCTGCAPAATRSPSVSARCSPTIQRSPCATCRAPRVAPTRVVFDSAGRDCRWTRCSCAPRRESRPRSLPNRARSRARAGARGGSGVRVAAHAPLASAVLEALREARDTLPARRGGRAAGRERCSEPDRSSTDWLSFRHRSMLGAGALGAFDFVPPVDDRASRSAWRVRRAARGGVGR